MCSERTRTARLTLFMAGRRSRTCTGSNIFNFIFDDVVIPATEGRIAILGCRIDSDGESGSDSRSAHLREGDESDSSPDHSYDDAPDDFDRVHHSRYEHAFPEVGDGRHDHGESTVRGDIKIFYTITYDHGNLVGDGNVGVGHIDSGNADDGDVLTADGSGGAAFEAPTGGGGGGGTDDQTAAEVTVDTTNFSSNLTAADDTVQAALETIDGFTQYQGTWQQAAWPAGVIVRRSGIPYLSLVNNNTEIPNPVIDAMDRAVRGLRLPGRGSGRGDKLQLWTSSSRTQHGCLLLLHVHDLRIGRPRGYRNPCQFPGD